MTHAEMPPREFWIDDLTLRTCGPWEQVKDMGWPDSEKVLHVITIEESQARESRAREEGRAENLKLLEDAEDALRDYIQTIERPGGSGLYFGRSVVERIKKVRAAASRSGEGEK